MSTPRLIALLAAAALAGVALVGCGDDESGADGPYIVVSCQDAGSATRAPGGCADVSYPEQPTFWADLPSRLPFVMASSGQKVGEKPPHGHRRCRPSEGWGAPPGR